MRSGEARKYAAWKKRQKKEPMLKGVKFKQGQKRQEMTLEELAECHPRMVSGGFDLKERVRALQASVRQEKG